MVGVEDLAVSAIEVDLYAPEYNPLFPLPINDHLVSFG